MEEEEEVEGKERGKSKKGKVRAGEEMEENKCDS